MKKTLLLDPIAQDGIDLLKKNGIEVIQHFSRNNEDIIKAVHDADALLVRTTPVSREIIEAAPNLKVIARHGVGVDHINIEAANQFKIAVTNSPWANVESVAEHIIGMMISLSKHFLKSDSALRKGDFSVRNTYIGQELKDKTLGIIGLGRIGQRVSAIALDGFNMKVKAYDPYLQQDSIDSRIVFEHWDEIFSQSDIVSLNLPLTEKTTEIIRKKEFKLMKNNAFFINCSRGKVVHEDALIWALEQGEIQGAGIDVFSQEPPNSDNKLFTLDNVIVTPHMAAHSHEAMVLMATHAAQGIVEVFSGKKPSWQVNNF